MCNKSNVSRWNALASRRRRKRSTCESEGGLDNALMLFMDESSICKSGNMYLDSFKFYRGELLWLTVTTAE